MSLYEWSSEAIRTTHKNTGNYKLSRKVILLQVRMLNNVVTR